MRTVDDLAETLMRKINAHPGGQYRVAAELQEIYGDESHLSAACVGEGKFILWSDRNHHRKLMIVAMKDLSVSRTRFDVDLDCEDIAEVAWWNDVIYVIAKHRNKWISAFDIRGRLVGRIAYPDPLGETYVTDCKVRHDSMLLAYVRGEVWHVHLPSLQARRIVSADKKISYAYVDFLSQQTVLYGHDTSRELSAISLADGTTRAVCDFPEEVSSVLTFEDANRGVMFGHYDTYLFELSSFRNVRKHELRPIWVVSTSIGARRVNLNKLRFFFKFLVIVQGRFPCKN